MAINPDFAQEDQMDMFVPGDVEFDPTSGDVDAEPVIDLDADGNIVVLDPNASALPAPEFGANLAEYMDEQELNKLGADVLESFKEDREARSEWESGYIEGLDLLGIKYEERNQPWKGASGATHSMMLEALIRFQAQTMAETFPASGPCKTQIIGKITREKEQAAARVKQEMNYNLTAVMTDYRTEHSKTIWGSGLAGEAFKKIYRDPITGVAKAKFVPAFELVRAYGSSDLATCPRYTHVFPVNKNDLRRMQATGFYRKIKLEDATEERTEIQEAEDEIKGFDLLSCNNSKGRYRFLEQHVDLDLKGFEDPDGIDLPYVVTVDYHSGKVLGIRRNWAEGDPKKFKLQHFVFYPHVLGMDGFGLGLTHTLANHARTATSTLRQLIDAGTLANLQGGLRAKGLRVKDEDLAVQPGVYKPVDVPSGKIGDSFYNFNFKEPSPTLLALHQQSVEDGRRLASTQDLPVGQGNQEAPVGTTLALLEQAKIPMTEVQAQIHAAMRQELQMLAALIKDDPPAYPYDTGVDPQTKAADFDPATVDILPVSDPNASTKAQRIIQSQALGQVAQQSPPGLINGIEVLKEVISTLGYEDAERFLNVPEEVQPLDPITENMNLMTGKPVKAGIDQDHDSHISILLALKNDPKIQQIFANNPQGIAALDAHLFEHVAFKYRADIQAQLGIELPPPGQPMPPEIEGPYSKLVAQAADKLLQRDIAEEQLKQDAAKRQDPIFQQQERELAIKEQANKIKDLDSIRDMLVEIMKMVSAREEHGKDIQADKEALLLNSMQAALTTDAQLQHDSVKTDKQAAMKAKKEAPTGE